MAIDQLTTVVPIDITNLTIIGKINHVSLYT